MPRDPPVRNVPMKISTRQLRQIIKEEVKKVLFVRRNLRESRDPVTLVAQFAEEQGVSVEDVHALWDWYNGLISSGEFPSDKKHKDSSEARLLFALFDSPLNIDSSDIKASIEASGGDASMVGGP